MPAAPHRYHAFGTTLDSDVAFPELRAAAARDPSGWALHVVDGAPPPLDGVPCGSEALPDGVTVRLTTADDTLRVAYDDTGTFDVCPSRRDVRWYRREGVSLEAMRTDVLSRVLAVAQHAEGRFCLHASASRVGTRAIGLFAPKGTGKSTLAVALARAGAPLLADDALALDAGDPVVARPGVPTVRLWDDSLRTLRLAPSHPAPDGGKHLLCALDDALVEMAPAPLDALYLLQRAPADARAAAERHRIAVSHAAVLLTGHAKLGGLARGALAPEMLARAAAVARRVPVFALFVARDLARLDEAARTLVAWHRGEDT